MALRMPRPATRPNSSFLIFRARVPADVIERARGRTIAFSFPSEGGDPEHVAVATAGNEVKFSLRTRSPAVAKARTGLALAHLERSWDAIRRGPKPLSHRQVIALSGEVYRLFVDRFEENPGSPGLWAAVKAFNRAVREGRVAGAPRLAPDDVDASVASAASWQPNLTAAINALPAAPEGRTDALEKRFGWLTDWVLALHSVVTDAPSRLRLLEAVEQAATDAAWRLKRAAGGDYSPDPAAQRFPEWKAPGPHPVPTKPVGKAAAARHSLTTLVEDWGKERGPRAKTLNEARRVMGAFKAFHRSDDAAEVTPDDVVAWKDSLVASGTLAARTINTKYLTPLGTVLNWAVANRRISSNPAKGIRAAGKAAPRVRERSFTDAEASMILKAALRAHDAPGRNAPEMLLARRWVPWLCAYTGARVAEITQLRAQDFRQEKGVWVFSVTPEAGAVKTDVHRIVPVHSDLIRQGILEVVRAKGEGPLFYAEGRRRHRQVRRKKGERMSKADTPPATTHPAKTVAGRLSGWVRDIGVKDPKVQPNHAWRHLFMTLCRTHNVAEEARYFIVGHTRRDTGQRYGEAEPGYLARELEKIPAFAVAEPNTRIPSLAGQTTK